MESEDYAIRALGPLFKLTEVYLWEDGSIDRQEVFLSTEYAGKSRQCYKNSCLNVPAIASDFDEAPEDAELIKQMGALGLPFSFQSNKETRYKINKGKRKGTHLRLPSSHEVPLDEALESTEVSQVEIVSSTVLHDKTSNSLCCLSMLDRSESNNYNVAADISDSHFSSGDGSANSNRDICDDVNDGISCYLSNNVHGYDLLSDVMSDDENEKRPGSKVSDAALSSPSQLTNGCFVKSEIGGSPKHICPEDSSSAYEEEHKDKKFCNDKSAFSQDSEVLDTDGIDSNVKNDDLGDWRMYWDAFYMRNYFYNIKTGTSTWDPPAGMELVACGDVPDGLNVAKDDGSSMSFEDHLDEDGLIDQPSDGIIVNPGIGVAIHDEKNSSVLQDELHRVIPSSSAGNELYFISDAQEHIGSFVCSLTSTITENVTEADIMHSEIEDPATNQLDIQLVPGISIQRKKAKKKRARRKSSTASEGFQCRETLGEFSVTCSKYWSQRYLLFSRFDSGIKMDEEGWYSVTPELIARHHASHCADDTIIDCFSGVGGNTIQFALRCKHVIAIDVDPKKIDYAYHNASIYGVHDKIDFIKGDFFVLAPKLKAGTVFLSPPWGGPDYATVKKYNMAMLRPHDGFFLFDTAKKIARKIVMFLPRNIDLNQLAEMCVSAGPAWLLKVEKNFLNGKLKAITAYFIDTTVEVTSQLND